MGKTSIEWADAVWNPVTGCSKVSAGCINCYAERLWARLGAMGNDVYVNRNFNEVRCHPERLDQPIGWTNPKRIFVNSMSDLFHDDVPFEFIRAVWIVMVTHRLHTYMVLTKRPKRMLEFFNWMAAQEFKVETYRENVWLGVSVENQETADERIPLLLQSPVSVRFVSCEPLLGPVNLERIEPMGKDAFIHSLSGTISVPFTVLDNRPKIDWVIVGGESGPKARPMHPDWVRSLRDQCQAVGVPYFFKQWGEWAHVPFNRPQHGQFGCWGGAYSSKEFNYGAGYNPSVYPGTINMQRLGKKTAGRELDDRTWDELPEVRA